MLNELAKVKWRLFNAQCVLRTSLTDATNNERDLANRPFVRGSIMSSNDLQLFS